MSKNQVKDFMYQLAISRMQHLVDLIEARFKINTEIISARENSRFGISLSLDKYNLGGADIHLYGFRLEKIVAPDFDVSQVANDLGYLLILEVMEKHQPEKVTRWKDPQILRNSIDKDLVPSAN